MTIEIKYAPGEQVWGMEDNKAKQLYIEKCFSCAYNDKGVSIQNTTYTLYGREGRYTESQLFPTKEALIESL